MTTIRVLPVDPDQLTALRRDGRDAFGRPVQAYPDAGGEQLRCCLRRSTGGERLLLVGHAPLRDASPWQEVGPVFVHAEPCPRPADGTVPTWFDDDPRVLRAYDARGVMRYERNRVVAAGEGVAGALADILGDPGVAEVHVRNLLAQCFVARVVRAG